MYVNKCVRRTRKVCVNAQCSQQSEFNLNGDCNEVSVMYLESSGAFATEVRSPQSVENETNCDRTSNLYFWLSLLLFVTGFVLTLVILDENEFGPLAKFWLIGPIFLCLAFVIAIKTLLYLRQKTLTVIYHSQAHFAQVVKIF